eukprot:g3662.t1
MLGCDSLLFLTKACMGVVSPPEGTPARLPILSSSFTLANVLFLLLCPALAMLPSKPHRHPATAPDPLDLPAKRHQLLAVTDRDYRGVDVHKYMLHPYYLVTTANAEQSWNWLDIRGRDNVHRSPTSDVDDQPMEQVQLDFNFQFYGYNHSKIFINPNGFISTNSSTCDYFCNWPNVQANVETDHYNRFIAGYMTDLNPNHSTTAEIHWWQGVTYPLGLKSLIVQYSDVPLFRKVTAVDPREEPVYTFQIHLYADHSIKLLYYHMPVDATTFSLDGSTPTGYPVRIGVEDAEIYTDSSGREALVRYAPLDLSFAQITEFLDHPRKQSVVHLTPKASCLEQLTCEQCVNFLLSQYEQPMRLNCGWCQSLGVCTDLMDRERDVVTKSCPNHYYLEQTLQGCAAPHPSLSPPTSTHGPPQPAGGCDSSTRNKDCTACVAAGENGETVAGKLEPCMWCETARPAKACRTLNSSQVSKCLAEAAKPITEAQLCPLLPLPPSAYPTDTDPTRTPLASPAQPLETRVLPALFFGLVLSLPDDVDLPELTPDEVAAQGPVGSGQAAPAESARQDWQSLVHDLLHQIARATNAPLGREALLEMHLAFNGVRRNMLVAPLYTLQLSLGFLNVSTDLLCPADSTLDCAPTGVAVEEAYHRLQRAVMVMHKNKDTSLSLLGWVDPTSFLEDSRQPQMRQFELFRCPDGSWRAPELAALCTSKLHTSSAASTTPTRLFWLLPWLTLAVALCLLR